MECAKVWLTNLGLQNYASNFEKYGWDMMDGLHLMTEEDILKVIGDGEKSGNSTFTSHAEFNVQLRHSGAKASFPLLN